ncbi:uncharacterized protein LOC114526077 [Dendronephthya gigantea]|uniref:uncharacterized protein LOC114526077 n=1 Tax=Dendronephthya gigantea TaxID=151771 RepID=UPI00106A798B|nr:uncharacterized protein LOC114526077 [Dendronephthya gigantea]
MAAESPEFTKILAEWLPMTGNWSVCWRATRDGSSKVPTLTVVKVVKNGKSLIFGGFATTTWAGYEGSRAAPGSFLFSFHNNDDLAPFKSFLKNPNTATAIESNKDSGPKFGIGPDLSIFDKTITQKTYGSYANLGISYQAPPGYSFGERKTQSLLAGSLAFTPAEVEVLYLN